MIPLFRKKQASRPKWLSFFQKTVQDLKGPFSVALLLITLGAAFGILSGRGASVGMVSSCVIALIMSFLSGTKYGVSSPTGPMTAAVAVILLADSRWLQSHSSELSLDQILNLTLLFTAFFVLLMDFLKVQKLLKFIPNLVVSGFVNGIAVLIIMAQFSSFVTPHDWIIALVTLLIALFSPVKTLLFPIIVMTLGVHLIGVEYTSIHFEEIAKAIELKVPALKQIDWGVLGIVIPLAFELALIVILDTLLTAVIMDKRTGTKSNLKKELMGQSLSLTLISLIGGIPGAQSTVPSVMMEKEKAHHKYAKVLIAIFCILITVIFLPLLSQVPSAVFGGVILKIAYDIADLSSIKSLLFHKHDKRNLVQFIILLGTVLTTVMISLNLAVISFTILFILWNQVLPKRFRLKDLSGNESEGLIDEI